MRRWYNPLGFVLGALAVSSCHGQVVLGGTEGDSGAEPGATPANTSRSGSAVPSGSTSSSGAGGSGMAAAVSSGSTSSAGDGGSAMVGPSCAGGTPLSGSVSKCSNGADTTLTGKVYDPAGKVPLSNVTVFVPNDPCVLPTITPGASTCNECGAPIGNDVSVAVTDSTGSFTLKDVPTGDIIPLVVQIGKWRRIITVPHVADCATTRWPTRAAGKRGCRETATRATCRRWRSLQAASMTWAASWRG